MRTSLFKSYLPNGQTLQFSSTQQEREAAFLAKKETIPDARWVKNTYVKHPEYSQESIFQTEALVWDSEHHSFFERYEKFHQGQVHKDRDCQGSMERKIVGNHVLDSGVYVDSTNQRLILPNGTWIDGPTGILHNVHGQPYERNNPSESKDV
jgi:hypothetical protein